jgi:hypothetical protein
MTDLYLYQINRLMPRKVNLQKSEIFLCLSLDFSNTHYIEKIGTSVIMMACLVASIYLLI